MPEILMSFGYQIDVANIDLDYYTYIECCCHYIMHLHISMCYLPDVYKIRYLNYRCRADIYSTSPPRYRPSDVDFISGRGKKLDVPNWKCRTSIVPTSVTIDIGIQWLPIHSDIDPTWGCHVSYSYLFVITYFDIGQETSNRRRHSYIQYTMSSRSMISLIHRMPMCF